MPSTQRAEGQGQGSNESERAKRGSFLWERQDGESVQAFARFLAYRDMEPTDRNQRAVARVCGISEQLVARWSKRWHWVKRSVAYDSWKLELSDELGKHGALVHRRRLVRFGSASVERAIDSLNKIKVDNVDDAINLAQAGAALERQALQLAEPSQGKMAAPSTVVQVGVAWPPGSGPAWANSQSANKIEAEQNVVVPCGEQVLGEGAHTCALTRPDTVQVSSKSNKLQSEDATAVRPVRLIEKVVKSPAKVTG